MRKLNTLWLTADFLVEIIIILFALRSPLFPFSWWWQLGLFPHYIAEETTSYEIVKYKTCLLISDIQYTYTPVGHNIYCGTISLSHLTQFMQTIIIFLINWANKHVIIFDNNLAQKAIILILLIKHINTHSVFFSYFLSPFHGTER